MSLVAGAYSGLLESKLRSLKFRNRAVGGMYLSEFCNAVGVGVVGEAKDRVGIINAPDKLGVSTGIGIVTIDAGRIAAGIEAKVRDLWKSGGPLLNPFCLAIGETTVEHFALASLTSDTNGTATFPDFSGAISPMANRIQVVPRWAGRDYWIKFCTAIATGICDEVAANGTGTLTGATLPPPGGGVVDID